MNNALNSRIQVALRNWIKLDRFICPQAVTLTLRQAVNAPNGENHGKVWLTEDLAIQNLRHFLNKLNRFTYGNAAIRFQKGVGCLPILEGGNGKRLHYHLLLDCPRISLVENYPLLINELWRETQWGYVQTDCRSDADSGWLNYITKHRDKPDFAKSIDWMNYRNP